MRIALVPPSTDDGLSPIENFFLLRGLETLLAAHELTTVIPDHRQAENHLFAELNRFDAIIFIGNSVFSKGNRHGFQWKADHIRLLKPQVIALGLGLPAREAAEPDDDSGELVRALHRRGRVSAADQTTQEQIEALVGKGSVRLVGCPALWMESDPLVFRENRRVFFPSIGDPAFVGRDGSLLPRLMRGYYRRISQGGRVLFMVDHPREFDLGARPGLTTLFCPHFPGLHLKAIASASAAVGFKILPLLAAVANNVPAVLLGNDPWAKSMAETAGIPFLELTVNTNPAELCHRTEEQLRKYPWDLVREKTGALRGQFVEFLKERGLSPQIPRKQASERKGPALVSRSGPPLQICSIADSNYLPFFLGLVENVIDQHPGPVAFHLLALDDKTEASAHQFAENLPITFHSLRDLWNTQELPRIRQRSSGFRAYSSKGRLLSKVLRETGGPVLYADADIYFFESPKSLLEKFEERSVLLFPHWGDSYSYDRRDGLYNAGMIAVRRGAEAFLEWWSKLCLEQCEIKYESGYVADQAYLDFAPLVFPEVSFYRDADHNVAGWNLRTLGVEPNPKGNWAPRLVTGGTAKSFHAAIADDGGFFEIKYGWDQIANFFGGLTHVERAEPLFSNTLVQQKAQWLALGRYLNANRVIGENFLPASHRPTLSEIRFFVAGPGRLLVRWLARARRFNAPTPEPTQVPHNNSEEGPDASWIQLRRAQIKRQSEPAGGHVSPQGDAGFRSIELESVAAANALASER